MIDAEAQERVLRYGALAERDGQIAARAEPVPDEGWFCPPTLAVGLPEESPVLPRGGLRAAPRGHARARPGRRLRRGGLAPFALTGGLFSRSPAAVERVTARARPWATST